MTPAETISKSYRYNTAFFCHEWKERKDCPPHSFSLHMPLYNKLIVITAPSGAGKTSITRHLLKTFSQLAFSISAATREPRNYETNGVDYYFIPLEEFKVRIKKKEFAEWEMVYEGKYYGTLKSELQRIWNNNQ